jgi:hypothetical protein
MKEGQQGVSDLLALELPCSISTTVLKQFARCIYDGGMMDITPKILLEMVQLADAIQVRDKPLTHKQFSYDLQQSS